MSKLQALNQTSNILFVVLLCCCLILLSWLSTRSNLQWDLTADNSHSLSADGQQLLQLADKPLEILAFAGDYATRLHINNFVDRYRQQKQNISVQFIDPWQRPDQVNRYKISVPGELVVTYGERHAFIKPQQQSSSLSSPYTEKQFNAALHGLLRTQSHIIYFVAGHGERPAEGQTNHGLSVWAGLLRKRGFEVASYPISGNETIPEDAGLLVLSAPQLDWLLSELQVLRQYLERGGALLWLHDPGPDYGMAPLAELAGIDFGAEEILAERLIPGSSDSSLLSPDPLSYPDHPLMEGFNFRTLFPQAVSVMPRQTDGDWHHTVLATAGKQRQPIALALARTVKDPDREQRIAIFGDGDFLANAFIANGGNAELGLRVVDWLTGNDSLIAALEEPSAGAVLHISEHGRIIFASFNLLVLPVLLLLIALRTRRQRYL